MEMTGLPAEIISAFGLPNDPATVSPIGTGHIHQTFRVSGVRSFIVQRVNKNVFRQPEVIDINWTRAAQHLSAHYPDYPFLRCLPAAHGATQVFDSNGFPWRVFPYIGSTFTIDQVATRQQAYDAAAEFARLCHHLDGADVSQFSETIPRFHDLSLRYDQFEEALQSALPERKDQAESCIQYARDARTLVDDYVRNTSNGAWKLRITHNDTKINNVLFDMTSGKTVYAIDLDTLMPGYFIYDVGDMIRTFVPPVSEEEKDLSLLRFRRDIYDAVVSGYRSEMDAVMSTEELAYIPWSGKMMTYMMALRFLADYLRGDTYYHTTYPGQNLVRARNQFHWLGILMKET
jgi:Ser/Thr protein kinase RdoA (MazF antagonist)